MCSIGVADVLVSVRLCYVARCRVGHGVGMLRESVDSRDSCKFCSPGMINVVVVPCFQHGLRTLKLAELIHTAAQWTGSDVHMDCPQFPDIRQKLASMQRRGAIRPLLLRLTGEQIHCSAV